MFVMDLKLVFLLLASVLSVSVSAFSSCNEKYCLPQNGDLAVGRALQVDGSCNISVLCTSNDSYLNDRDTDTDWVSEPGQQNATIQLNLETSFRFVGVKVSFVSFVPAAAVLEVSADDGDSWRPVQYYATDCPWYFQMPDKSPDDRPEITDVICTPDFTRSHQTGGDLLFNLTLPHHLPFWATDPLHLSLPVSDLTITNLRLRLVGLQPINSLVPISYAIHSFEVYGACHCFGHASTCVAAEGYEGALVPGVCECRHNTEGEHCEMCLDGYNKRRWGTSKPIYTSFCERCACNSHSQKCHYDIEAEKQICDDCKDNTTGDSCELCELGYFQNPVFLRRGWLFHPEICKDCNCNPRGALTSRCDSYGYCKCKRNVMGAQCDQCKPGFYGLDASDPDGCRPCVCGEGAKGCDPVSGKCLCKAYADGLLCQTCANGYYGPFLEERLGCRFCGCSPGTTVLPRKCDVETGTCLCREGVEGDTCSLVTDGYYVEEITQDDVDTRIQPMCERGGAVACDLAGIWFDESTQTKRCEEDVSGDKCCSYSQKIISIFLNNGGLACSCHSNGSVSTALCDKCGGQCDCESYTSGRDCSQCSAVEGVCEMCPRATPTIGDCINCFCNGFSQECTVARGWTRQLTSIALPSQDWTTGLANSIQIVDGYNPFTDRTETHLLFSMDRSDEIVLIRFPDQYLGDRRHAYAAELSLSLSSNFIPDTVDLFLLRTRDNALVKDISSSFNSLQSTFDINLTEEGFFVSPEYLPASEHDLRRTLIELDSVELLINATSSQGTDGRSVSLFMADLWDSVSNGDTGVVSGNVEVCDCSDRYTGQFCERCSPGYTRSPNSGGQFAPCETCLCNGHSTTCDPEDGTCTDCQENTRGKFCDECREGFYGDPSSPLGCLPCLCPTGPTSPYQVTNSCLAIQPARPEDGHVCDCPISYVGRNCESCAEGHRGDPVAGIPCEQCDVCYDQYLELSRVVPSEIAVLNQFIQSCQNWQDGFDFFELVRANLNELTLLISRAKLSNSTTVCQLRDSLNETRGLLNELSQILINIQLLDATDNVQNTEQIIQLTAAYLSGLQNVSFSNFIEEFYLNQPFYSYFSRFNESMLLLNTSNSFFQTAKLLQVILSKADASISRIIQLYLSIDLSEFPGQLATLEGYRNVVSEVSIAARTSLCGVDSTQCEDGTYQRLVVVATQLQTILANTIERRNSLIEPYNSLSENRSIFEDLLSRLSSLSDVILPINTSVCELVPLVHYAISRVNASIEQPADVSELERVSSEILQLTISLSLTETTEIVLLINSTLEQVLANEAILKSGIPGLQLPTAYLTVLNSHYDRLQLLYEQLLSLSPDVITSIQSVTEELSRLQLLIEQITNLNVIVQQIISDVAVIGSQVPGLRERVANITADVERVTSLRENNQIRLSEIISRANELKRIIEALGVKTSTLIPEAEKIVTRTKNINNTVMERFSKLFKSYPRIQTLRATLAVHLVKLNELQAFADSLTARQVALEALLTRTENHLATHVLSGQLQEIDSTGKCLNYVRES